MSTFKPGDVVDVAEGATFNLLCGGGGTSPSSAAGREGMVVDYVDEDGDLVFKPGRECASPEFCTLREHQGADLLRHLLKESGASVSTSRVDGSFNYFGFIDPVDGALYQVKVSRKTPSKLEDGE